MKKLFALILSVTVAQLAHAQFTFPLLPSPSVANTSVADTTQWYPFQNPAILGGNIHAEITGVVEHRFNITELATKSLALSLPTPQVNLAASVLYSGFSLYHEIIAGLTFSRQFSTLFSLGMQFNYLTRYYAPSDRYYGTLVPQIGLLVPMSSKISMGLHLFNPFQTSIRETALPSIFSIGMAWMPSENFTARLQAENVLSGNYRFAAGFDFNMLHQVIMKMGFYGYEYLVPCLGFAFQQGYFRFHLNGEMHPLLGLNTIAGLAISLNHQQP